MTVRLITGSDPSLVSRALTDLVRELTGAEPAMSEVEEFETAETAEDGESKGRHDLAPILAALSTPPWLSEHRIVVVRDAGALTAAQGTELGKFVAEPPAPNILVLASAGKAIPQSLAKAVKAAGGQIVDTDPGRQARARNDFLEARIRRVSVHLDSGARRQLIEHLGEDAGGLDPILEMAEVTYGSGARITAEQLEPLLGEEGSAPPWALTDAIDSGNGEEAIRALRRMLGAGGRHPLQILATLHRHVSGMLRLDGAEGVHRAEDAAALLGMKSTFPAEKVLKQCRRLGHERIIRAVTVLADADADLRGRVAWPSELVMEVAVARLAQLSRATAQAAPVGPARGGRR